MARSKAAIRADLDKLVEKFQAELFELVTEYIAADDDFIAKRTEAVKGDRRKIPLEAQPFGLLMFRVDGGNPIGAFVDRDGELPDEGDVVDYLAEHLFPS